MIRYAHTNIIAKDWKQLVDFYVKVFGCDPVPPQRSQAGQWLDKGTGVEKAALEGMHLRLPGHGENGPTLEVYSYQNMLPQSPVKPNQRGIGHLAFEVDHLDKVVELALKHGASKHGEVSQHKVAGVGTIEFIYIADPEGNIIELQHWS